MVEERDEIRGVRGKFGKSVGKLMGNWREGVFVEEEVFLRGFMANLILIVAIFEVFILSDFSRNLLLFKLLGNLKFCSQSIIKLGIDLSLTFKKQNLLILKYAQNFFPK